MVTFFVTATDAVAAAAKDKEVTYPFNPVTRKDMSMAAISPEVSTCHVCFGSCILKGVDWSGG